MSNPSPVQSSSYHTLTNLTLPPFVHTVEALSYPSPAQPTPATVPHENTEMKSMDRLHDDDVEVGGSGTSASSLSSHSVSPRASMERRVSPDNIYLDATFTSFEEFRLSLEEWMRVYFHPFRVASSETLKESDGTLNQLFKYRYIVYHCAHYGHPRKRGVGKRPNQQYLPCGCNANLRLNYSFTEKCLKITTLKENHVNHELSSDLFNKVFKLKEKSSSKTAEDEESTTKTSKNSRKRVRTEVTSKEDEDGEYVIDKKRVKRSKRASVKAPSGGTVPSPPSIHSPSTSSAAPPSTHDSPLLDVVQHQSAFNLLHLQAQQAVLAGSLVPSLSASSNENTLPSWMPAPPPNLPAPQARRLASFSDVLCNSMSMSAAWMNALPFARAQSKKYEDENEEINVCE